MKKFKPGEAEDYELTGDPTDDVAEAVQSLLFGFALPPLPTEDEALAILSRAGWDRAGGRGRLVDFRKGTEWATMERGEIPWWAQQVAMGMK